MTKVNLDLLRQRRLAKHLDEAELAEELGISVHWYLDLERDSEELLSNLSLRSLFLLMRRLDIPVSELFPELRYQSIKGEPRTPLGFKELHSILFAHIGANNLTLDRFGDQIGWGLESFLSDAESAMDWNIDCLKAVCHPLELDWCEVIEVEFARFRRAATDDS